MLYGQVLCSLLFLTHFLSAGGRALAGWQRPLAHPLLCGIPDLGPLPWLWMQGIALLGASRTAIFMNLLPGDDGPRSPSTGSRSGSPAITSSAAA